MKNIALLIGLATLALGSSVAAQEKPPLPQEVVELIEKAEAGDAEAQGRLGSKYRYGIGVVRNDKEAVKWFRKAAEQGYASAQFNLGAMYANGEGVLEDSVMAYAWMNIAGANGNSNARDNKSIVAKRMTKEQIAEAQKLSRKLYDEIEKRKSKGK